MKWIKQRLVQRCLRYKIWASETTSFISEASLCDFEDRHYIKKYFCFSIQKSAYTAKVCLNAKTFNGGEK